ncbi:tRNA pseudouridine(13) synthase TruD [Celerinatantimonas diazotrophica]|uniref:tRNA pseudouridine synthase D n=1 Tax=Celerinatantimonas diazotrophica TaxID=412034 RepID=A0A4R1J9D5_9GAMM|nr:tRNA pseudouridine(13) synthase TruD [Celerinatantimonas diazotrophica]TCK47206.1 tRNA pseudouridine13 synthase [Celerinatantimonas diazotrophica]CAG9295978.1 tRNA pseudouridine synthase D [Celerinatantimonas diazotrophica]
MLDSLAYFHGEPATTAAFKVEPEDFQVTEILPFAPSGQGEHVFIQLQKRGENTLWAANALAQSLKVSPKLVSFAGLKDRQGVTSQWFSIQLPVSSKVSPASLALPSSLKVLQTVRHHKKLRRGVLKGNQFVITLKNISSVEALLERLDLIRNRGVPNYFGAQRFGHGGNNLTKAAQMFAGKRIKDREKRGLYLSAARSMLFNQVTSARFQNQLQQTLMVGDCVLLRGSHSFFVVEAIDDMLRARLKSGDIQISAPLFGDGDLSSSGTAREFEQAQLAAYPEFCEGLVRARLKQERRAILVFPEQIQWRVIDSSTLQLEFFLPAGCYATSVIRELANVCPS